MVLIEAVIFDLDGTLLDTETLSTQSMQMVLDKFGKEITWSLKERTLGRRGNEWGPLVCSVLGLDESQITGPQLVQEWEENMSELCKHVKLVPGADQWVAWLKESNVKVGIATSSSAAAVASKRLVHPSLFEAMDIIVCGDDEEV